MNNPSKDYGVSTVLLNRFVNHRLPIALRIKTRVEEGACLTEAELSFLHLLIDDATQNRTIINGNPQCQQVFINVVHFYHDIVNRAFENEQLAVEEGQRVIH